MSKVELKDLEVEVNGEKVALGEIIETGIAAGIEAKMGDLKVTVPTDADQKAAAFAEAANFIKSMIVPTHLHEAYGVKAIDTTGGSFGTVVPTALRDEIVAQSQKFQIVRRYAFVFSLTGKITLPQEGTGVTAYWVAENAAVTESNPTATGVTLDDHGLACLVKVSWKLLRTADRNIVDFVSRLSAKAITETEEAAFVNGDGSGKPLGIRQTSGITAVAQAGGSLAYADIVKLYHALPVAYRQNAQFLTSGKGAQLLHLLADSQARPLFAAGQALDQLFGKPLLESSDIPENLGAGTNETEIHFGDLSNYWIKDGSDIEMATQDQIENLQTKIVVYKYVDGKIVVKDAFRKLTGVK